MDVVLFGIQMVINMLEIFKTESNKDTEFITLQMGTDMKATGLITKDKELEFNISQTMINMMGNGLMAKSTVKEYLNL